MNYRITQSAYKGSISAPASKSYLQRAVILAAMAEGVSIISNYTQNEDTGVILNAVNTMGASASHNGNHLKIRGGIKRNIPWTFHCNESGLAARMLCALSVLNENNVIVTGSGSLMQRPMNMVAETLKACGKKVVTNNNCLPFEISGKINVSEFRSSGIQTSQFITGLLIALPLYQDETVLHVDGLKSKPYIELTLDLISQFGLIVENENLTQFRIPGRQHASPVSVSAECDWSGAAFHLVGAAIAGDVELTGLDINSRQADKTVMQVLKDCGANCDISEKSIRVKKEKLMAFNFDACDCPDLVPPLAVLAANCKGISKIKGTDRLQFKESNRAEAIISEFSKLGIKVENSDNTLIIHGSEITGGTVLSHNDHRIAMALAIMGLKASSPVTIEGMECISKSYPGFIKDFEFLLLF